MTQIASDNFTRANGPIGSNWTNVDGVWSISSDAAVASTNGSDTLASVYWSANIWPNDQYSQITLGTVVSGLGIGPAVRVSSSVESYYWAYPFANGNIYLQLNNAGTVSNLANAAYTGTTGDVIYIGVQGTTITIKVNGATLITHTDATLTSGNAGMASGGTNVACSATAWAGGNFLSSSVISNRIPVFFIGSKSG